ncbi:putative 3-transmembrane protein A13, partial [Trypanosoma cruzi]
MADTVTLTDPTTGEVVLLTSGKLHSSATSSSSVVGLWPHGDGRDDDTAFFKREDDAYEEWTKKKKKQMQWEQQQRKENENEGKDNDKKESSKKASRSKLEEFSAEAVKSRSKARRQHLN